VLVGALPGTPVDPTAASTFGIFAPLAGQNGLNGQAGVYAVKYFGVLTDAELQEYSAQATPPSPVNRYFPTSGPIQNLPRQMRSDTQWAWVAANGNTALNADAPAFTWAVNGSPVGVNLEEQWYRDPRPFLINTTTPFRNSRGMIEVADFSQILYTTVATESTIALGQTNDDAFNDHTFIGVSLAGGAVADIPNQGPAAQNGEPLYIYLPQPGSTRSTYAVAMTNNIQCRRNGFLLPGATIQGFVGPQGLVPTTPAINKRLLFVSSLDASPPDGLGPGNEAVQNGFVTLCRTDFPTAGGPGGVTCVGGAFTQASLMIQAGGGSAKAWAGVCADAASEGNPTKITVVIDLGMAAMSYDSLSAEIVEDPAAFEVSFAALVDALHVQIPAMNPGATVVFYATLPIQKQFDAVPNSLGHTLAEYTAAIVAVGATRPWLNVIDVTVPNVIGVGDFIGGGYSTTPTGASKLHLNVKAALGADY